MRPRRSGERSSRGVRLGLAPAFTRSSRPRPMPPPPAP
jgi:hypothetical protein